MRRSRSNRGWILHILIGAMMVGLTLLIWIGVGMYRQRKATESMIEARNAQANAQAAASEDETTQQNWHETLFSGNVVSYGGKTWRRNTYIKAILCMGVDRQGSMQKQTLSGDGGQADGVFLLAQDTARGSLKILMIPRDCMTPIMITDISRTESNGTELGKEIDHLTLAYAYGDGREKSCEYMVQAVSDMIGGFPIDYYLAADTDIIATLNDQVGGVEVTVPTVGMERADPAFVAGQRVHLGGKQAERFVRYRDTTKDNSALMRMMQQQEYITGFFDSVKVCSRTDSRIVEKLFDMATDHMVTDMSKDQYMKIALDALTAGLTAEDFRMVPGQGTATETYDEFYVDRESLTSVILELFYRQAD